MRYLSLLGGGRHHLLFPAVTAVLAAGIFVADVLTPPDCVVSGLDVIVVLMSGRFLRARGRAFVFLGCATLTVIAQILAHRLVNGSDQLAYIGTFNALASIIAMGVSAWLVARNQQTELAMQRARSDLAQASRITTLGELTASIAHEVNQPIAGVVTNANASLRWLAADPPNIQEARAATSRIVRDGTRAADIITRIRGIFAKTAPKRESTDTNRLIRETVDLLGAQAARFSTSISLDLTLGVPSVMADRVQIQQVLVNLIVNGLESMKDNTGPRALTVRSGTIGGDKVEISISDLGVGLPAEGAERIFDSFFSTKELGTGLGLSISRTIVESHDGILRATRNVPQGTTLSFTLPAVAQRA
ncbi:MAG: ATP-binding protein [Rhizomicrobium sp.]|jgi:C4-dicarboxylate-specific signal transduction histidine kinase